MGNFESGEDKDLGMSKNGKCARVEKPRGTHLIVIKNLEIEKGDKRMTDKGKKTGNAIGENGEAFCATMEVLKNS